MGFVDYQRVVLPKILIPLELVEQNTVGHQLDGSLVRYRIGKPDLIPHQLAERRIELIGDALSHVSGRQSPGLGMPDARAATATELQANLGKLGSFSRPRLPCNHHYLMMGNSLGDLRPSLDNGQLRGKVKQLGDSSKRWCLIGR